MAMALRSFVDQETFISSGHLATAVFLLCDLTGENVPEGGDSIIHGLVVDTLVQVLNEDVADSRSPQRGITVAPHDPDGTSFQHIEVQGVQSTLS